MKKTEIMMGGERITILGRSNSGGKTPSMLSRAKEPKGELFYVRKDVEFSLKVAHLKI
jgi:hypothetical protein